MNRLNRIKKLEEKKHGNDVVIFFEDGYRKLVNGVNEYITKEEYEEQTKNMKTIEWI